MGTDHLAEARRALEGMHEPPHDIGRAIQWAGAHALVSIAESLNYLVGAVDRAQNGA